LSYGTRDASEHHVRGVPGRARIGTGTDLEVKRPGPLATSKMAATSCRLRRVFGPHGNDRHGLHPDTDRVSGREGLRLWHCPQLSIYSSLHINLFSLLFPLHRLVPPTSSACLQGPYVSKRLPSHLLVTCYSPQVYFLVSMTHIFPPIL
jgi:hypothetical protein